MNLGVKTRRCSSSYFCTFQLPAKFNQHSDRVLFLDRTSTTTNQHTDPKCWKVIQLQQAQHLVTIFPAEWERIWRRCEIYTLSCIRFDRH